MQILSSVAQETSRPREVQINLRQIKYIVKVAELGSMTAAAHELGIAQPALGAQIRQLEITLNLQLIERHSRGVIPTPAGLLLAQRGRVILADIDDLIRDLKTAGHLAPRKITLGVSPTMVLVLGDVLLGIAEDHMPNVTLNLIEERAPGMTDALRRQQVDLAFIFDVDAQPGLSREAILEEDLLLVCAPGVASSSAPISFSEALSHQLVMAGARGILRNIIASEAHRFSLDFNVSWEVHSIAAMKAMVISGKASTIIPYSLAAKEIDQGILIARKIDRPRLSRILYMVRRKPWQTVAFEAELRAFLAKVVKQYLERTSPWTRAL